MRKILAILILVACSFAAEAQIGRGYFTNNPDRKFYGGFAVGFNFSALKGDAYEGYRKVGLNLGPTVYVKPVSYTHLDVYKRQVYYNACLWSIYPYRGTQPVIPLVCRCTNRAIATYKGNALRSAGT